MANVSILDMISIGVSLCTFIGMVCGCMVFIWKAGKFTGAIVQKLESIERRNDDAEKEIQKLFDLMADRVTTNECDTNRKGLENILGQIQKDVSSINEHLRKQVTK